MSCNRQSCLLGQWVHLGSHFSSNIEQVSFSNLQFSHCKNGNFIKPIMWDVTEINKVRWTKHTVQCFSLSKH